MMACKGLRADIASFIDSGLWCLNSSSAFFSKVQLNLHSAHDDGGQSIASLTISLGL
jgi:hypothetical protein